MGARTGAVAAALVAAAVGGALLRVRLYLDPDSIARVEDTPSGRVAWTDVLGVGPAVGEDPNKPWRVSGEELAAVSGKTAVVTGGNAGIGLETVKALAVAGFRVVLGSRTKRKGDKACDVANELVKTLPGARQGGSCEARALDLSSLKSTLAFAETFTKNRERVDVLVLNAGTMTYAYEETEDGLEKTFGVNVVAHLALVRWLVPAMATNKASDPSRVVIVSSYGHRLFTSKPKLDASNLVLTRERFTVPMLHTLEAYGNSKVCLLYTSPSPRD